MRDLFDDEFFICLVFLPKPEYPIAMFFHVFNIVFGMQVLINGVGDREAGFNFLSIHSSKICNSCATPTVAYK